MGKGLFLPPHFHGIANSGPRAAPTGLKSSRPPALKLNASSSSHLTSPGFICSSSPIKSASGVLNNGGTALSAHRRSTYGSSPKSVSLQSSEPTIPFAHCPSIHTHGHGGGHGQSFSDSWSLKKSGFDFCFCVFGSLKGGGIGTPRSRWRSLAHFSRACTLFFRLLRSNILSFPPRGINSCSIGNTFGLSFAPPNNGVLLPATTGFAAAASSFVLNKGYQNPDLPSSGPDTLVP